VTRLIVEDLPLLGLKKITRKQFGDHRGFLSRLYCNESLSSMGYSGPIAQINHTYTQKQGVVRGMHFQYPPHAEVKLVSCIRGEVWDVAVDLRKDSSTFLQWHAEKLSIKNGCALLIPEGFAHGFQTLSADCELIYLHSAPYMPNAEGALNILDTKMDIKWPFVISETSERDKQHPMINSNFEGITTL